LAELAVATRTCSFVAGEWVETGEPSEVRSPFSGRLVATVGTVRAADVVRAVDAASDALRTPLPAHRRAAILDGVAAALDARCE
jgi:acyl-CoA reductase-like NAD-dependent aldehyde dehydrogenase